jgi:hypothetical protein
MDLPSQDTWAYGKPYRDGRRGGPFALIQKKAYAPLLAAMTVTFLIAFSTAAIADNIVNNLDASIDAEAEIMPLNVGASGTTSLYVDPVNGDGHNGCNFQGTETLVLAVASSDTSKATVSPSSLTFGSCGDVKILTVTGVAAGSATISVSQTSNNTGDTFNLDPATFTVNVTPPPNTPPSISVTGVTGGASYEFGSVPSAGCAVTDTEDGNSTFAATLSAVSGPLSAYGLGSQTASCSYTDAGGLTASSSVIYSIVDTTEPALSLPADITEEATSVSGATAAFSVSATDAVDPAPVVSCSAASGDPFPIGTTTVSCTATDVAGNVRTGSFDVTVQDTTDPIVAISTTATAGLQGWYNLMSSGSTGILATVTASDTVGVTALSCEDNAIPIAGVSTSGDTFTLYDDDHDVTCTAEDAAGNSGSDSENFKVDQTPPTIAPNYTSPSVDGWNNTDLTVSFTCSDATSGIDPAYGCPLDQSLTANGLYVLHVATADDAGNVTTPSFTIKIDKDAPTIIGVATPVANGFGWNNTDVAIDFTCFDALSGLKSCTDDTTLTGEGANQSVPGTAVDKADNSSWTTVGPINIDKTPPTITFVSRTASNVNGWNNGDVTVDWSCSDGLSGVAASAVTRTVTTEGADQSATGTCTDKAGNSASDTQTGINIDKTDPTASASASPVPNANGWNNTDVTVSFSGSDGTGSGIDFCDADVVLGSEGAGQSASGTCTDLAGNVSDPATATDINIDKTDPSVALVGGPTNGATYYFGFVPSAPTCTASDALSGVDGSCSISGYDTSVGTHTVQADAMDRAGNQGSDSATYTVLSWTLKGFYQPVDMNGVLNVVKGGSTVPLKFEIFAGSTELTDTSYVQAIGAGVVDCIVATPTDVIESTATGGTSLRYDTIAGQFIYNWQTPKQLGTCYAVTMTTQDGSKLSAYFKLK